jgi:hypothetical protein
VAQVVQGDALDPRVLGGRAEASPPTLRWERRPPVCEAKTGPLLSGTANSWCPAGTRPLGGGYFPFTGPSALRTVAAAFAINDVDGAPGFSVTMANEGGTAGSFHVTVRCASVS